MIYLTTHYKNKAKQSETNYLLLSDAQASQLPQRPVLVGPTCIKLRGAARRCPRHRAGTCGGARTAGGHGRPDDSRCRRQR